MNKEKIKMRETILWHLKKLSHFYGLVSTCNCNNPDNPNKCGCKCNTSSPGYWAADKKEIDNLIANYDNHNIIRDSFDYKKLVAKLATYFDVAQISLIKHLVHAVHDSPHDEEQIL